MNRPYLMVMTSLMLVVGTSFFLPTLQNTFAQYSATNPAPGTLEEQLKLAQDKVTIAQQNPSTGSGTSMLNTDFNQTLIVIAIIVAIFGAIAGMFFAMGRGKQQPATTH
ncbi:MAG: hypothetical protein DA328_05580 [Nitrososphaeraceae archaeon]|nr:hypothetical protein [Nitrososphaeraceae archaeon]